MRCGHSGTRENQSHTHISPPGNNTAVTQPRYRRTYGCIIPDAAISFFQSHRILSLPTLPCLEFLISSDIRHPIFANCVDAKHHGPNKETKDQRIDDTKKIGKHFAETKKQCKGKDD
jgi:hypothetical protein